MPLSPDVAGETDRLLTLLKDGLEGVRAELARAKADKIVLQAESLLQGQLSAAEWLVVSGFLPGVADAQARIDACVARRDALVKAINLLRSRLGG